MNNLSFGSFRWPRNPGTFCVEQERKPVYRKNELGEPVYAGLSEVSCTITGTGVFTGAEAWASYRSLEAQINAAAPAPLHHPRWGSCSAYLTGLQMTEEPKSDYISYRFTFTRADAQGAVPQR